MRSIEVRARRWLLMSHWRIIPAVQSERYFLVRRSDETRIEAELRISSREDGLRWASQWVVAGRAGFDGLDEEKLPRYRFDADAARAFLARLRSDGYLVQGWT